MFGVSFGIYRRYQQAWDFVNRARVQQCTLEVVGLSFLSTLLGGKQKCRQPDCDACHLASGYPNKLSVFWTPSARKNPEFVKKGANPLNNSGLLSC